MSIDTSNENNRRYIPSVGANVRLRTWSDYTERGLSAHMWSHFRVLRVEAQGPKFHQEHFIPMASLQRINGTADEGAPIEVPCAAIEPPIGWKPRYTIYCHPGKVVQVLGWFARGIRVKTDLALDRLAGDCFMPADVDTAPTWGYGEADVVRPADCPNVFSVTAYVEQEFHMPKDKWLRRQYQKACRNHGWKVWNRNYGAHGYAWFRSKECPVYVAGKGNVTPIEGQDWYVNAALTPPLTPLDLLSKIGQEHFPHTTCSHHKYASDGDCTAGETCSMGAERIALRDGLPIARWILNRAEYWLNGYDSKTGGNSTWMFDPSPDAKDPVNRKGDK